jgi:hypothetical protein
MFKSEEGSTGRLIQLCIGYFVAYVVTGIAVKYYTDTVQMEDLQFLVYSTVGGSFICLAVVFIKGWYRWADAPKGAYAYIIPSGIFTAVVIPTTTLMYMLPISVMVAMVIMRASVIVIGRAVDEIQIRQGLLKKRVYQEENTAVIFALTAAGLQLLFVKPGDFDFVGNPIAMSILGSYIVAYAFRIYIMNYYKNTRPKGSPQNNQWFFSIEQIAASVAMLIIACGVFFWPATNEPLTIFRSAITAPHANWPGAVTAGFVYGVVAFFSVFIFMFKGRTATFANLVNRLTSLVAGTMATLCTWQFLGGKPPKTQDWVSLTYILIAVAYLSIAEKKRVAELQAGHELAAAAPADASRSGR